MDDGGPAAALNRFDPLVRDWFTAAFAEPTTAQAGAWDAIGKGDHTLVVAPTGSGKTLAAFLSAIDDLVARGPTPAASPRPQRCTVLYLSPLKALAVDVERNLRSPLTGIGAVAARRGRQPAGDLRRGAIRRHPVRRSAGLRPRRRGHPDHHPGIAVPAADQPRPGNADQRPDGHHRRGARRCRHQTWCAPGRLARPAGCVAGSSGATDRAVGHRPAGRGGRQVPGRRPPGDGGAAAVDQADRRRRGRPGAGHERVWAPPPAT